MSDTSYSAMLRELSKEYYLSHIDTGDYRVRRKEILDKIDEEYNGHKSVDSHEEVTDSPDLLLGTISFYKNTDIEE